MVKPFHKYDGVKTVTSGYTGGAADTATYPLVCTGTTGHVEAVLVEYDESVISYEKLLEIFWQSIDPTDAGGQFHDRGEQYRPAIFYFNDAQKELAEKSLSELDQSRRFCKLIAVSIECASVFYPAEDFHQYYYLKNPEAYESYQQSSGRAGFLDSVWKADKI